MGQAQCPVCYSPLEARQVTPCFICGGWPESVARFDTVAEFREYRLPSGQLLVLCRGCALEEFMVPGGWGYRLGLPGRLPIDALQPIRLIEAPELGRDKVCPTCNLRLAFLELVADNQAKARSGG